tara:strand:+ start:156 stop:797 length:642 start_codon:yes stop_codon:yes gene_type:complete
MMLNEIIVLIFGIIIAVTILLMLRKIIFGRRTNLKINKKVNSRELFEPLENDLSLSDEVSSFDDTEDIEQPQDQLTPEAPDNLFVINLEGEDKTIAYKNLISILEEHSSNYSNEGGWFRIFSDDHYFSLVNGLNPGRFDISKEDDETTALTLILSPVSGTNTISNLNQMVTFAELLASKLDLNLFDSERNPLTQQMIDHYSHQAEEFDLRNFA